MAIYTIDGMASAEGLLIWVNIFLCDAVLYTLAFLTNTHRTYLIRSSGPMPSFTLSQPNSTYVPACQLDNPCPSITHCVASLPHLLFHPQHLIISPLAYLFLPSLLSVSLDLSQSTSPRLNQSRYSSQAASRYAGISYIEERESLPRGLLVTR